MKEIDRPVILTTESGKDRFRLNKSINFLYEIYKTGTPNNLTLGMRIKGGGLDLVRMVAAAEKLYADNDCFRMILTEDEEGPCYQFLSSIESSIEVVHPSGDDSEARYEEAKRLATDIAWFELMSPLKSGLMVIFYEIEKDRDVFVFICIDHLVADGTSLILTAQQFLFNYLGISQPDATTKGTMMEFFDREEALAASPEAQTFMDYWNSRQEPLQEIPFTPNTDPDSVFDLTCAIPSAAMDICLKQLRTSPSLLIQAAFHLALTRHSGRDETDFDYCSVNRFDKHFVNTLGIQHKLIPCRVRLDHQMTLSGYVTERRSQNAMDMKYQALIPGRCNRRNLVVQELGGGLPKGLPFDLTFWNPGYGVPFIKKVKHPNDLVVMVFPQPEHYLLKAIHSPTYYRCDELKRLFENMRDAIIAFAETPEMKIGDLLTKLSPTKE